MINYEWMYNQIKEQNMRTVAVAVAQDEHVLIAISEAVEANLIKAILVGNQLEIENVAKLHDIDIKNCKIVNEVNMIRAAEIAVKFVSSGEADFLMKGLIDTASFLKAVLNKEFGLRTGKLLSHVAVIEIEKLNKTIILTDGAMNIAPDVSAKKQIIDNAVEVARGLGIVLPKVAIIGAVEVVNSEMQATLDAAVLTQMNRRGQIKNCVVDGPFAIDNALSKEAAEHKGIHSEVAGEANILLMPNIESGNIMYKTLTNACDAKSGGIISGASAPIILTSRTDSAESKLNSIILASLLSKS